MANITLEAVEAVMEQAKVEYPAAKEALIQADGDVEKAVRILKEHIGEGKVVEEYTVEAARKADGNV